MEERLIENNSVEIRGTVVTEPEFDCEMFGEKFYKFYVETLRSSGVADVIPVTVSELLIDDTEYVGKCIEVTGQFRSCNRRTDEFPKHLLFVFAKRIDIIEACEEPDENYIFLDGFICKKPIYRTTPFGRQVADVFIAVNRAYNKSDYIPCITWGRNAIFSEKLAIGTHIAIIGRIQSREFEKHISETETIKRVAYEVSVNRLKVIK